MYYEEKIIDGILCWRNDPDGPWIPFTLARLSGRTIDLQSRISSLEADLQEARFSLERIKEIASPLSGNTLIGKIYIDADHTLNALARIGLEGSDGKG